MIAEDNKKAGWNLQRQAMGRNIAEVLKLLVVLVALELELECK